MGFSKSHTARKLQINFRTVARYWDMKPTDYAAAFKDIHRNMKNSIASHYETDILAWLEKYPDLSNAQIYDWLYEKYGERPVAAERTMRRYRINQIIGWHHEEPQVLCHGDFHWDNLLLRENGEIVICDWQGVNAGGASGDISFFISRLGADGTEIAPEKLVEIYVQERALLTGVTLSEDILLGHMQAANSITTFQFWYEYLHGSACGRVRGIYEKMGK